MQEGMSASAPFSSEAKPLISSESTILYHLTNQSKSLTLQPAVPPPAAVKEDSTVAQNPPPERASGQGANIQSVEKVHHSKSTPRALTTLKTQDDPGKHSKCALFVLPQMQIP